MIFAWSLHGAALILYIARNRISLYLRIAAECWIVYRLIFPLIDTDNWYFVNFWNIDIRLSEFYWIWVLTTYILYMLFGYVLSFHLNHSTEIQKMLFISLWTQIVTFYNSGSMTSFMYLYSLRSFTFQFPRPVSLDVSPRSTAGTARRAGDQFVWVCMFTLCL